MELTLDELRMLRVALHQRVSTLHELADQYAPQSDMPAEWNAHRANQKHVYRAEAVQHERLLARIDREWASRARDSEVAS